MYTYICFQIQMRKYRLERQNFKSFRSKKKSLSILFYYRRLKFKMNLFSTKTLLYLRIQKNFSFSSQMVRQQVTRFLNGFCRFSIHSTIKHHLYMKRLFTMPFLTGFTKYIFNKYF